MKAIKSILNQQLSITMGLTVTVLAFMTVPAFDSVRSAAATQIGLEGAGGLWFPAIAFILAVQALMQSQSLKRVALPLRELARNAKNGEQGFAFKTKSKSSEEDAIKHAIEAYGLKAIESQQLAEELETELDFCQKERDRITQTLAKVSADFEGAEKTASELRIENEKIKGSKLALELTLENERKAKVGVEVEKRVEEIYAQMEHAVAAAACKAIWIPSLVQELKSPIVLINEISSRLQSSCSDTPLSKIAEQVALIHRQSETQLALLAGILSKQSQEFAAQPDSARALSLETAEAASAADPRAEATEPTLETAILEREPTPNADEPETSSNPYDLESIFQRLVIEFTPLAPDALISYSLDHDLKIVVEDESLLALMHSLVKAAVSVLQEGEIVIGADLTTRTLLIDVACEGDLSLNLSSDIEAAQTLAQKLNGKIEVERSSPNELHFAFAYPLDTEETSHLIESVVETSAHLDHGER